MIKKNILFFFVLGNILLEFLIVYQRIEDLKTQRKENEVAYGPFHLSNYIPICVLRFCQNPVGQIGELSETKIEIVFMIKSIFLTKCVIL